MLSASVWELTIPAIYLGRFQEGHGANLEFQLEGSLNDSLFESVTEVDDWFVNSVFLQIE